MLSVIDDMKHSFRVLISFLVSRIGRLLLASTLIIASICIAAVPLSWAQISQRNRSFAGSSTSSPPLAPDAPLTPTVIRLISSLTLDEKLSLVHLSPDPESDQIGNVGYVTGVPRLGIPPRRDADALGIQVVHHATALPSRIGLTASFDRTAVYQAGEMVGTEGRALGIDLVYAPQVDLARIPTWGRNNA